MDGGLKERWKEPQSSAACRRTHVNQVVVGGLFGGVEGLWLLGPAGGPRLPLLGCGATEESCDTAGAFI